MIHRSLLLLAASLLLVGAGCASKGTQPPATNQSTAVAPSPNGQEVKPAPAPAPTASLKLYTSAPYDFSYPSAYMITDRPMVEATRKTYLDEGMDAPLQYTVLATQTGAPEGGEGPPSITVIQWNNAKRTPLREWARKQERYTNFNATVEASGKVTTADFAGRTSLSYEYDGLYGGKMLLIDLDGTVLAIGADFDANMANPTNMRAFDTILATLTIAP